MTDVILSREELAVSCFGMTPVEAIKHLVECNRKLDEFFLSPDNNDFIKFREDELYLMKPFISKAMNYIQYGRSLVPPKDKIEADLLQEIYEKLL